MPELQGFSHVSLSVRDRENNARWYGKVFGFEAFDRLTEEHFEPADPVAKVELGGRGQQWAHHLRRVGQCRNVTSPTPAWRTPEAQRGLGRPGSVLESPCHG